MADLRSSHSYQPAEIYSPSDFPEPDKSIVKTQIPYWVSKFTAGTPSTRDQPLPCKYITHGNFLAGRQALVGSYKEH